MAGQNRLAQVFQQTVAKLDDVKAAVNEQRERKRRLEQVDAYAQVVCTFECVVGKERAHVVFGLAEERDFVA